MPKLHLECPSTCWATWYDNLLRERRTRFFWRSAMILGDPCEISGECVAANLFVETDALACAQTIPAVLGQLSGDGSAVELMPRETACDCGTARSAFRKEMDLEGGHRGHHNP